MSSPNPPSSSLAPYIDTGWTSLGALSLWPHKVQITQALAVTRHHHPALPPNHSANQASVTFTALRSHFRTCSRACSAFPGKPYYVNHKPFWTPLVHVCHYQSWHLNQIWVCMGGPFCFHGDHNNLHPLSVNSHSTYTNTADTNSAMHN